jgi:mono/diheme cytochrome c family protein
MQKTWALGLVILILAGCVKEAPISGKRLFSENCVTCHGTKGQGDGTFANSLMIPPADLTALSANNDGVFPRNRVISAMDGYARGKHFSGAMPEFGRKLAGSDVLIESGDGVVTPTPRALVTLAEYLESLQGT